MQSGIRGSSKSAESFEEEVKWSHACLAIKWNRIIMWGWFNVSHFLCNVSNFSQKENFCLRTTFWLTSISTACFTYSCTSKMKRSHKVEKLVAASGCGGRWCAVPHQISCHCYQTPVDGSGYVWPGKCSLTGSRKAANDVVCPAVLRDTLADTCLWSVYVTEPLLSRKNRMIRIQIFGFIPTALQDPAVVLLLSLFIKINSMLCMMLDLYNSFN